MTAIQPGSVDGMIEAPGTNIIPPGMLPVLIIVMTVLISLLLVVNILQLITAAKAVSLLRKLKVPKNKKIKKADRINEPDGAHDRFSAAGEEGSNSFTGCNEQGSDAESPAYAAAGRGKSHGLSESRTFTRNSGQEARWNVNQDASKYICPDAGSHQPDCPEESYSSESHPPANGDGTPAESMYPVEINPVLNYNPLLPVRFRKVSGDDAVFTFWSDHTIRPSEICFMGFNSVAYYSAHRFSNVYDFVDRQGTPIDLSKVRNLKLVEVMVFATATPDSDEFCLERRGKIKVEVMI